MKVVFYNGQHNGDVHMSRQYVRDIIELLGPSNDYYYEHLCNPKLLVDIPNLKHVPFGKLDFKPDIYIPTWTHMFFNGCNFVNYYSIMRGLYQELGIIQHMKPVDYYVPYIDYTKFDVSGILKYFSMNANKEHVLVCNNDVASGQAPNGPMNHYLENLVRVFPDVTFVASNTRKEEPKLLMPNLVYATDIIEKELNFDLNEIAMIASKCDVIIGRSSGPYSFSVNKDTIKSKKFICFCSKQTDTWFLPDSKNIYWSNDHSRMLPLTIQVLTEMRTPR